MIYLDLFVKVDQFLMETMWFLTTSHIVRILFRDQFTITFVFIPEHFFGALDIWSLKCMCAHDLSWLVCEGGSIPYGNDVIFDDQPHSKNIIQRSIYDNICVYTWTFLWCFRHLVIQIYVCTWFNLTYFRRWINSLWKRCNNRIWTQATQ